jgi:hypothetical protein
MPFLRTIVGGIAAAAVLLSTAPQAVRALTCSRSVQNALQRSTTGHRKLHGFYSSPGLSSASTVVAKAVAIASPGSPGVTKTRQPVGFTTRYGRLRQCVALAKVLTTIVGESLAWETHWKKSRPWAAGLFGVVQLVSILLTGRFWLLSWRYAAVVLTGLMAWRCLLPAAYAALAVCSWSFLAHGGHMRRILHEAYILTPFWFSNKLLNDSAEGRLPQYLQALQAHPCTISTAQEFVRSRKDGLDITSAIDLAHSSGTLVLYTHSFGPTLQTSPDWPHVVMHCCYGRILDDYQDMEEDARDGNFHRNFFLRSHGPLTGGGGGKSSRQEEYIEMPDEVTIMPMIVQAMRGMQWHEAQIVDPLVRQYAQGCRLALEVLMLFKNRACKRLWKAGRDKARLPPGSTVGLHRLPPWPFQSLVPDEIVEAASEPSFRDV